MHLNHLKRTTVLLLSFVLICSLSACQKLSGDKTDEKTTESTQAKQSNPDYVKEDVVLPENFGNMIYPIEALMVEEHSKGLPYYTDNSSEEETSSFWFSMAVLTSQMNHYVKDVAVETDDRYIYIDEETTNMYASALYDAFGRGDVEFPDRGADNPYAAYDTDKGLYGFRQGTIGDLEPYVTDCQSRGEEYVLTVHLKNKGSVEILSSYEITIVPTAYESEDNAFNYSVKDFGKLENSEFTDSSGEDTSDEEMSTEETEITTDTEEKTSGEADNTGDNTSASTSTEEDDSTDSGDSSAISTDDALDMAKDYYGDDAEYSYKETVTIGDYEYYDFSVEGDGITATDVLVSVDGQNVVGGVKNNDGSWSFDQ